MKNYFIPLSDLKAKAKREVQQHLRNLGRSTKLLNSIMGSPATNKSWLTLSESTYRKARQLTGEKRIVALVNALFDAYKCEIRMMKSTHNDKVIPELRMRIETSYLNETLGFIEENIHDEDSIQKNLSPLRSAIRVLNERNKKLAHTYLTIINQSESLQQTLVKLDEFFILHPEEISLKEIIKIKGFMQIHRSRIRKDPYLQEMINRRLHEKIEEIYNYYYELVEDEKRNPLPSLKILQNYYDQFDKIYTQLKTFVANKKLNRFVKEKQKIDSLLHLLQKLYPELKKMYNYLSFPRKHTETKGITDLLLKYEIYAKEIDIEYQEIYELSPSLLEIRERLEATLSSYYRDDLIQFYKYYNEIMNSTEAEERAQEMILFLKYLASQLMENDKDEYVRSKLTNMKNSVNDELFTILEDKINLAIKQKLSSEIIRTRFDQVFHQLTELSDIETIELLQNQKRKFFKNPESFTRVYLKDVPNEEENNEEISVSEVASDSVKELLLKDPRLVILDNFSIQNIVIFTKPFILIGRNDSNDIILRCSWVSSQHCRLSFDDFILEDSESTNGTKVSDRKIKKITLSEIDNFSIANSFDFAIMPFRISYAFYLTAVKNQKLMKDESNKDYLQSLLNTKFIWLADGDNIDINPATGKIILQNSSEKNVRIERKGNRFFITDHENQIFRKPIHADGTAIHERFSFQIL